MILLALLVLPAPLLPPHWLAGATQSLLGIGGKAAYLVATIALQALVYGFLGAAASLAAPRATSARGRALRLVAVPLVLVVGIVIIRSLKLGHVPVLANAVIPLACCAAGVGLGLLLRDRRSAATLLVVAIALGAVSWALLPGASSALGRETQARLKRLVAAAPALAPGAARFEALLLSAFAPLPGVSAGSAVEQNRTAILALGIAVGHERLARLVGLDPGGAVRQRRLRAGEGRARRAHTRHGGGGPGDAVAAFDRAHRRLALPA